MSDLVKDLRITAGMIAMGEKIAWGSDSGIMEAAADEIERLQEECTNLNEQVKQAKAEGVREFTESVVRRYGTIFTVHPTAKYIQQLNKE